MISQEFISALRRDIEREYQDRAEPLIEGKCRNFEDYCAQMGFLAGLRSAREILDELVKKANAGEIV